MNHITGDIHYVSMLLRRRKTLLTVHDCGFETYPSRVRRALIAWIWLRTPAFRCKLLATDSEFSKGRIVAYSGCAPSKVVVVGGCISPVFRRHDKAFNIRNPTILFVGTNPHKNLARLCEALKDVSCSLRVIGPLSGVQRDTLDNSGVEWSSASGLSEQELYEAYTACDLVAFPSTYEGFGLPIIEANTVGRPVVTSVVTSMPEVAGDAACLVDPYDVSSIRQGILRVIEDETYRKSLVELGFANALRFSGQKCAEHYVALYRRLAGDSRGPGQ